MYLPSVIVITITIVLLPSGQSISEKDLEVNKDKWIRPGLPTKLNVARPEKSDHRDDEKGAELREVISQKQYANDGDGEETGERGCECVCGEESSNERPEESGEERLSEKTVCVKSGVYIERLVRRLSHLTRPHIEEVKGGAKVKATIGLKPSDWIALENYKNIETVLPLLSEMIVDLEVLESPHLLHSAITSFYDLFGFQFILAVQVLFLLSIILLIIRVFHTLHISLAKLLLYISITLFIVSIPWQGLRLYKEALSNRARELSEVPEKCLSPSSTSSSRGVGVWSMLTAPITSLLSSVSDVMGRVAVISTPQCKKYYDALHVDPILDVTPMKALIHTVLSLILEPLALLGSGINQFLVNISQDLPVLNQWMLWLIMPLIVMWLILLGCGFSVKIPFLLHIERSNRTQADRELQQLTANLAELRLEHHQLRSSISSPSVEMRVERRGERSGERRGRTEEKVPVLGRGECGRTGERRDQSKGTGERRDGSMGRAERRDGSMGRAERRDGSKVGGDREDECRKTERIMRGSTDEIKAEILENSRGDAMKHVVLSDKDGIEDYVVVQ